MFVASFLGHLPVVAALLERGADVEAVDEVRLLRSDGSSRLFCAIIKRPSSPTRMPGDD